MWPPVETPNRQNVRFKLKEPWPDFLTFYGSATGAGWVVPRNYVEKVGDDGFKKAPIGAGPYKLVSFTPGVELVLEALDEYRRTTPSVRRLVIKSIPEESTRLAALKRGEVDIAYNIRGELAKELQRTPGLTLKPVYAPGTFWLDFPEQWDPKPPWHDERVRQAASLALDRKSINRKRHRGKGGERRHVHDDAHDPEQGMHKVDESGGYWDSGCIQILDAFGDGTRIPLIAVSPFARKGAVDHTYTDHVPILKFIEADWGLGPLSERSRAGLPNPAANGADPYIPANRPAIGDLMSLFQFWFSSALRPARHDRLRHGLGSELGVPVEDDAKALAVGLARPRAISRSVVSMRSHAGRREATKST
jgi:ABC-type transport system substrate-binding protein